MTAHEPDQPLADAPETLTAVKLMRLALALLDRAGELIAAARLQHAIDSVVVADDGELDEERAVQMLDRLASGLTKPAT